MLDGVRAGGGHSALSKEKKEPGKLPPSGLEDHVAGAGPARAARARLARHGPGLLRLRDDDVPPEDARVLPERRRGKICQFLADVGQFFACLCSSVFFFCSFFCIVC